MNSIRTSAERRIQRIAALTAAALLGVLAGLVGLLVPVMVRHQQQLPLLQPDDFDRAQQRWDAIGPASYNLEVVVTGRQPATYYVEVRDGEVTTAMRDGEALSQRRTMGTWSVPGMLTTIHMDVLNLERHRQGTADSQTPQLLLRGVFDEHDGHPRRYHRTELRRWGPNAETMWEVRRFEVVGGPSETAGQGGSS